jgi:E3 ubiquitin-protein ligase RAD18
MTGFTRTLLHSDAYGMMQCIRVSLANKQECPSCRKTASEAHIRPNPALDKVISDWKNARCEIVVHYLAVFRVLMHSRPFVLQLVRKAEQPSETHSLAEPKTAKKRKRIPSRGSSTDTIISGPSRLPSSPTRVNSSPSKQNKTKYIDMTIPSSDVDEEEISIPNRSLAPKGMFP